MIRICWISHNFRAPYVAGGNRMFVNLFSSISSSDVEVHVITNAVPPEAQCQGRFIVHGVETNPELDPYNVAQGFRFIWKAARLFFKLHMKFHFDIVQTLNTFPPLGLYLSLLAKAVGCKSVLGFLSYSIGKGRLRTLWRALRDRPIWYRLVMCALFWFPPGPRLWFRWLDGIIVVSRGGLSALRDMGIRDKQIFLVPPGVDLQIFRPREASKDPPYQIIYASSCYPWKGIFDLLEAFRIVLGRGFSAELVYVFFRDKSESGTDSSHIFELQNRVVAVGLKDRVLIRDDPLMNIAEIIAQADILACPLRSGITTLDIPMSVLEGAACGLPVIGTRIGGIPEAVADGVNGYLVEPSDPDALAAAIIKMLENPERMKKMGEESRHIAGRFSARNSALLLQEMYAGVVAPGR